MQMIYKPFNFYLQPEFPSKDFKIRFLKPFIQIKLFKIFQILVALFPMSEKKDCLTKDFRYGKRIGQKNLNS